jgi:hypothetical protein
MFGLYASDNRSFFSADGLKVHRDESLVRIPVLAVAFPVETAQKLTIVFGIHRSFA